MAANLDIWKDFAQFLSSVLGNSYELDLYELKQGQPLQLIQLNPLNNPKIYQQIKAQFKAGKTAASQQTLINKPDRLKSSLFLIKDEAENAVGLFAITHDLSSETNAIDSLISSLNLQEFFQDSSKRTVAKSFSNSIEDAIKQSIDPKYLDTKMLLSPAQKEKIIAKLYQQGIFARKRAVPVVAKVLRMSEPSVYRYLHQVK